MASERHARLHAVIWVMIYSGLLLAGFGGYMVSREQPVGWVLVAFGAVDALAGFVLIAVRARMEDDAPPPA